jgi:ADP-ribosylglycohydrolase
VNLPTPDHDVRLARAYQSLEGLSCGDAFGERFFLPDAVLTPLIQQRSIPAPPWFFTDDTMMALSIVATLAKHEIINQDYLAMSFAEEYDSSRGYGQAMHGLLRELRPQPASWRDKSPALFRGEGSFGNGAAMRVAPLGAYFADDLGTLVEQAERSAIVTHCHAEGVAGAVAVALAAGIAAHVVPNAPPSPTDFLECICDRTPESAVRRGIQRAINLPNDVTVE